jgi:thioredoxin-dependent peroxiredoxin
MAKSGKASSVKALMKGVTKPKDGGHELEGKRAPAFELPDQNGSPVSLKALTSRGAVVVYFYPKDMTPGCTTEACNFRDSLDELRSRGAQIVGISPDFSVSHQKFIAKHALNFPLLSDAGNNVSKAYGVFKKKSLYGRSFMGIERTTFVIDRTGKIRRVFPKVKVNGHAGEVLAALGELE